jgi:hypothetical protein
LTTKTAFPPYQYYKEKIMEKNTAIKAYSIKSVVVLAKEGYGLVLWRFLRSDGTCAWGPVCTCGCRSYPEKNLENFAKQHELSLLFEIDVQEARSVFGRYIFSEEEIGSLSLLSKE